MSMHERFRYKTKDELLNKALDLGLELPFSDEISPLLQPVEIEGFIVPNRLVVQPMEGYDSEDDGSPSALTKRRYIRYAEGGSGMIWFEAVSVSSDGRSNPRQLWINSANISVFKGLNELLRSTAKKNGINPLLVIQLTHSGRYSKPDSKSHPLVASLNETLDKVVPHVLTDPELTAIQDQYVEAAKLAAEAGYDAIDLKKACHGYLMIETLAARSRLNSVYGGVSLKRDLNFLETIDRIKTEVPGMVLTTRLNISDLYKGGFGVNEDGSSDFTEPLLLVEQLEKEASD